jgi:hypothetical protein
MGKNRLEAFSDASSHVARCPGGQRWRAVGQPAPAVLDMVNPFVTGWMGENQRDFPITVDNLFAGLPDVP